MKKQALAGLLDVFGNGREQIRQQSDTEKDELYTQIGQLLAAISEPLHIALAPHKFIHL